jgi:hypothetical protein
MARNEELARGNELVEREKTHDQHGKRGQQAQRALRADHGGAE